MSDGNGSNGNGSSSPKCLTIQVPDGERQDLDKAGYQLCIARLVNGGVHAFWQTKPVPQMEDKTPFYFTDKFALKILASPDKGVTKQNVKDSADLTLGRKIKLDQTGKLGKPAKGDDPHAVVLDNQHGKTVPALTQESGFDQDQLAQAPIYAADQATSAKTVKLTPGKVRVWFQQHTADGLQSEGARSNAVEVDMSGRDSATVVYKNGTWSLRPGS